MGTALGQACVMDHMDSQVVRTQVQGLGVRHIIRHTALLPHLHRDENPKSRLNPTLSRFYRELGMTSHS